MNIPIPYCDMHMECPECLLLPGYGGPPEKVALHLATRHSYTEAEAENSIKSWMDGFDGYGEDGAPLTSCPAHGLYPAQAACPGCDAVDQSIDRWKESKKTRGTDL